MCQSGSGHKWPITQNRRGEGTNPDANTDTVPDANTDTVPDANTDTVPDANTDTVPDADTDTVPDADANCFSHPHACPIKHNVIKTYYFNYIDLTHDFLFIIINVNKSHKFINNHHMFVPD